MTTSAVVPIQDIGHFASVLGQKRIPVPFIKFPGVKFLWMSGFAAASMPTIEAERHTSFDDGLPDLARRNLVTWFFKALNVAGTFVKSTVTSSVARRSESCTGSRWLIIVAPSLEYSREREEVITTP